ncbi:hypothetical protein COCVIDRAFT_21324 [Bipolaris victoriae FI3]|uniref:Uncharacterized protein n=1 Tax=Bipolaris victoriae (strain FI3) TaxID=930091 RepID=W7E0K8_BIPV3|nr:hypothetical protein COCVIDRAFT_21324 [Bipolaris victoriae FI3]
MRDVSILWAMGFENVSRMQPRHHHVLAGHNRLAFLETLAGITERPVCALSGAEVLGQPELKISSLVHDWSRSMNPSAKHPLPAPMNVYHERTVVSPTFVRRAKCTGSPTRENDRVEEKKKTTRAITRAIWVEIKVFSSAA